MSDRVKDRAARMRRLRREASASGSPCPWGPRRTPRRRPSS